MAAEKNGFDGDRPVLRVGIVGDVQARDGGGDWGTHNLARALDMLAERGIDVLLMVGDLADCAEERVFATYRRMVAERFGDRSPEQLACAGNHDFWVAGKFADRDHRRLYEAFCRGIGQSAVNPYHAVVKGYHFIAMSEDVGGADEQYSAGAVAALETEIRRAESAAGSAPIFVLTHYPPRDTVSGSHDEKAGQVRLGAMLKAHPTVVSFSGHTHYPLEDERSVWQGEYTAVTTSTLAYGCMEEAPYNSCNKIVPFAREVNQALYMEVFEDKLVLRRLNVAERREIKPDRPWVAPLPFEPERAVFTARRRGSRRAPEFPPDARMLLRYDFGFSYLIFDAARHDDFVHFYRLRIVDSETGETVFDRRYVSDFYRLARHIDSRQVIRLPGEALVPGRSYRYELFPEESFGLEGAPLVLTATVPERYVFRSDVRIYPQE